MSQTDATETPISMDDLMALCKRRGFIYQASEIYGGINGFWDYGPLGAQLKRNLADAWWNDVIMMGCSGRLGPDGKPVRIVPLDTCIIQNPKVWVASGHVGGFNDPMVDCRETKARYRADHLFVVKERADTGANQMYAFVAGDAESEERAHKLLAKYLRQSLPIEGCHVKPLTDIPIGEFHRVVGPHTKEPGTLTEPRMFNLMFESSTGAIRTDDSKVYLRPETAQGVFINYKNVVDTMRVRIPFGIANIGTSFRNEVTPRNFTFRSREFEQMECEFFCHPSETRQWYEFWRDYRMWWWESIGLKGANLRLREHDQDELAHYAKTGAGTADVEYRYPFTFPGYGELEGIADRSNFDLMSHQEHSKVKMEYFDQERNERYVPHCIEPAAGLSRGVLAVLCEAYTPDPSRPSQVYMKFHPRLAPIKAAIFPLVNKDGMPEIAERLHADLHRRFGRQGFIEMDAKQNIGKRYARMDEAGCPFCFTIDGDSLNDHAVTVRHRDTLQQDRIAIDKVGEWLGEKLQ